MHFESQFVIWTGREYCSGQIAYRFLSDLHEWGRPPYRLCAVQAHTDAHFGIHLRLSEALLERWDCCLFFMKGPRCAHIPVLLSLSLIMIICSSVFVIKIANSNRAEASLIWSWDEVHFWWWIWPFEVGFLQIKFRCWWLADCLLRRTWYFATEAHR